MAEGTPSLFTWEDEAGVEHTLNVDVVSSRVDERTATVVDHPVEAGSVVADNVVINPPTVTFELVVSQTPVDVVEGFGRSNLELDVRASLFVPGGFFAVTQGVRNVVSGLLSEVEGKPTAVNVLQNTGAPRDRVNDVHDELIRIFEGALLVTVNFKGRIYPDYLLTRITLTDNPGEFGMGRFTVDLRTVTTVTGEVVELPDPADFRVQPKKSKGNKSPKPPDPDPTKLKSLAASLADAGLS